MFGPTFDICTKQFTDVSLQESHDENGRFTKTRLSGGVSTLEVLVGSGTRSFQRSGPRYPDPEYVNTFTSLFVKIVRRVQLEVVICLIIIQAALSSQELC